MSRFDFNVDNISQEKVLVFNNIVALAVMVLMGATYGSRGHIPLLIVYICIFLATLIVNFVLKNKIPFKIQIYTVIGAEIAGILAPSAFGMGSSDIFLTSVVTIAMTGLFFEHKATFITSAITSGLLLITIVFKGYFLPNYDLISLIKSMLFVIIGLVCINLMVKLGNSKIEQANNNTYESERMVMDLGAKMDQINAAEIEKKKLIADIKDISSRVTLTSSEMFNVIESLSNGSIKQAAAIDQMANTVSEISTATKANAEDAREAKRHSGIANKHISEGNTKMEAMINAMDEIYTASEQIEKIINDINDIAFQTNILALNAAVEAARAGDAGKGFAVVADEVRILANRSAEAVDSTSDMIENTLKAVENGKKIANSTSASLDKIVTTSAEIITLIEKIDCACESQSLAISDIEEGLNNVSTVVQMNTATAEESASSTQEMSNQAANLEKLIQKFSRN